MMTILMIILKVMDGVDEIDDDICGSDIDENSSDYDDHSSVVAAANMDDE